MATTTTNGTREEAEFKGASRAPASEREHGSNEFQNFPGILDAGTTLKSMGIRISGTKMKISYMGMEHIGIMAYITGRLIRDHRRINIDKSNTFRQGATTHLTFELSGSEEDLNRLADEIENYSAEPCTESKPIMPRKLFELRIIAPDRPGVINDLSRRLRDNNINIVSLVSDTTKTTIPDDTRRLELIDTPRGRRPQLKIGVIHCRVEISSDNDRSLFERQIREFENREGWRIHLQEWDDGAEESTPLRRSASRN
jgi:predicted amino acid-binding ACT domain protein